MWTMKSNNSGDHKSVTTVEHQRRRPGRPRDVAKLEAILHAANDLFLERGIAATTMDDVAERASVSKMTVYANFRDKPALLAAVLDRRVKAVFVFDELPPGPDLNSSLERLVRLGEAAVSAITKPEVIRMTLLMAEQADHHPQLAATFYAAGRGELLKRIASCLKTLTKRGFLSIKNPDLAAEQLVASWLGMSVLRQGLGVAGPPAADEIAERVRYAVDTVIRAWSTRRGSANVEKMRSKRGVTSRAPTK
jgi:TetR/AcrR family transcriptional regulator, mexJK operon transcriptional repressor